MSIHIEFENGSNPYVRFNMTSNEFTEELEKWQVNYDMQPTWVFGMIYSYFAKEKMHT